MRELRDVGPGHPDFHRAQVIRAAVGVLAKSPDGFPAIAQAIRAADRPGGSPQLRAHLAAAEAWRAGNPILAAERYSGILNRWPSDLLALRLAQSCYFFLGWNERLCELVDGALAAWKGDGTGFRFLLATASFAHAEQGNLAYAETLGRRALLNDPACPLGVHAVAHALAEAGQSAKGARWMRDQHAHWAGESRMRTHNAWHLAMFDIEEGNAASALGILDDWLLPGAQSSPLEACDATALLWRLSIEGVDDQGRWRRLSDAFERMVTPGFWAYVDLHAGLAHLMAAKRERMRRLAAAVERCAQGRDHAALRARHITEPGLRALAEWADGRYGEAAGLLAALHPFLRYAGGSRLQLEVFRSVEQAARRRGRVPPPESTEQPSSNAGSTQPGEAKWRREAATAGRAFAERFSSP